MVGEASLDGIVGKVWIEMQVYNQDTLAYESVVQPWLLEASLTTLQARRQSLATSGVGTPPAVPTAVGATDPEAQDEDATTTDTTTTTSLVTPQAADSVDTPANLELYLRARYPMEV